MIATQVQLISHTLTPWQLLIELFLTNVDLALTWRLQMLHFCDGVVLISFHSCNNCVENYCNFELLHICYKKHPIYQMIYETVHKRYNLFLLRHVTVVSANQFWFLRSVASYPASKLPMNGSETD